MKLMKSFLFSIVALCILFNTTQAKAGIGAMFAAPVVVTAGLVVAGTGGAGIGVSTIGMLTTGDAGGVLSFMGLSLISGIVGLFGLVVLDGEQGMSYAEISEKDGLKIGLTLEEIELYNLEIDQVNAIASYVDSKMADIKNPKVEDSKAVWEYVSHSVSPETFKAMQTITTKMFEKR